MTDRNDRPLVSFVVLSYNQEQFIREAVLGAFAQTYSPLEVIISDDCSQDHTFEIVMDLVSGYKGEHETVVNRNKENIGLIAHMNKIFEMANGKLLVLAAGDDISFGHRTETLVSYWLRYGRPGLLVSGFQIIDSFGYLTANQQLIDKPKMGQVYFEQPNQLSRHDFLFEKGKFVFCGATQAVSRELYNKFGPINGHVNMEDASNSFRSLLFGGRLYLPDKLLKYRVHDKSLSHPLVSEDPHGLEAKELKFSKINQFLLPSYKSYLDDLDMGSALELISTCESELLKDLITKKISLMEVSVNWWNFSLLRKIKMYYKVVKKTGTKSQKNWAKKRFVTLNQFAWLVNFKKRIRSLFRFALVVTKIL